MGQPMSRVQLAHEDRRSTERRGVWVDMPQHEQLLSVSTQLSLDRSWNLDRGYTAVTGSMLPEEVRLVRWWHMVALAMAAVTLFWAGRASNRTQPPPSLAGLPA